MPPSGFRLHGQDSFHSNLRHAGSTASIFSGENQKGDVSFEVWKFELNCLIRESIYPDSFILQAVRKSLKDKARDILLTLGKTASPTDMLIKLEGIYGNVSSSGVLLQ